MCGKAEAAVNPKSACKSRQICVCVCFRAVSKLILTVAGSPKATSQSHSCPFLATLPADKKLLCSDVNSC